MKYSQEAVSGLIKTLRMEAIFQSNRFGRTLLADELNIAAEALEQLNCNNHTEEILLDPLVFKDGICPKCGRPTHGIGNDPMRCESCGWTEKGSETP